MQKLDVKLHPIATVFPPMTDEEFQQLKADIEAHGQRESIVYWNQMLIDGRHRLRACQELGIEPMEVELEPNDDPVAFALSCNLHRRHLTTSQRSMVAAKLATLKDGKRPSSNDEGSKREDAATLLNVSTASVDRAKQVIEHGSKDVIEAVETGEIPVSLAAKLVAEHPDKREQAAIVKHGAAAVRDYLQDEPSPVPSASEEQATNNLAEFKKFWAKCSKAGKVAIRVWLDENYLEQ